MIVWRVECVGDDEGEEEYWFCGTVAGMDDEERHTCDNVVLYVDHCWCMRDAAAWFDAVFVLECVLRAGDAIIFVPRSFPCQTGKRPPDKLESHGFH